MTPLAKAVREAIVNSDCYCRPGDPTCEDWVTSSHRWNAQSKAVVRALRRLPLRTRLALLFKRA